MQRDLPRRAGKYECKTLGTCRVWGCELIVRPKINGAVGNAAANVVAYAEGQVIAIYKGNYEWRQNHPQRCYLLLAVSGTPS